MRDAATPAAAIVQRVISRSADRPAATTVPLRLQAAMVLAAALAVTTFSIVAVNGRIGAGESWLLLWPLCAIGAGVLLVRGTGLASLAADWLSPLLLLSGGGVIVAEVVGWFAWGTAQPLEITTLAIMRNVVVGLAIVPSYRPAHPICLSLSAFLALSGATGTDDVAAHVCAILFGIVAVVWLLTWHWHGVQQRVGRSQSRRLPRFVLVVPAILGIAAIVSLSQSHHQMLRQLAGFLRSSGGTGLEDQAARSGVGSGEMLVAGTNQIQTFAPIDDAPLAEDHEPSLYDIQDDTSGEPVPPKTDRAISLPQELRTKIDKHLHTVTEKANKTFSVHRRPAQEQAVTPVSSIRSKALLYVAGRVPLHLRLEVYSLFDGETWYPDDDPRRNATLDMQTLVGRPWLTLQDRAEVRDYLGALENHAIKVVRLDTNIIPAPLYLTGIHIDLVDRLDMFFAAPGDRVGMNRDQLPSLVPIHLISRVPDARRLSGEPTLFAKPPQVIPETAIPNDLSVDALDKLIAGWTIGCRSNWEKIDAVINGFRREFRPVAGANAMSETEGGLAINELLQSARGTLSGPATPRDATDFQIATAAAMAVRHMGHATRLVSGLYAHPARYDVSSQHTPVMMQDLHYWVEVNAGAGDWITVEPAAGYHVLKPRLTWAEHCWQACCEALAWVLAHGWESLAVLGCGTVVWSLRLRIVDVCDQFAWRIAGAFQRGPLALWTVGLLLRRASRAGSARPPGMTVSRWLSSLNEVLPPGDRSALDQLRAAYEHSAFSAARGGGPLLHQRELISLVNQLSLAQLKTRRPVIIESTQPL